MGGWIIPILLNFFPPTRHEPVRRAEKHRVNALLDSVPVIDCESVIAGSGTNQLRLRIPSLTVLPPGPLQQFGVLLHGSFDLFDAPLSASAIHKGR
jgi:hypothetical protein